MKGERSEVLVLGMLGLCLVLLNQADCKGQLEAGYDSALCLSKGEARKASVAPECPRSPPAAASPSTIATGAALRQGKKQQEEWHFETCAATKRAGFGESRHYRLFL